MKLGVSLPVTKLDVRSMSKVAAYSHCWWHNSDRLLKTVLTMTYFHRLGLTRLSYPQTHEPPGGDTHAGWCGRGASDGRSPMPF